MPKKKKSQRRVHKISEKRLFDKYDLYLKSVQSPDVDVTFFRKVYKELKKKDPKIFREDFCGTFTLSCEWVKLNSKYQAYGIDLDPEPLEYGRSHYLTKLSDQQQRRIHLLEKNVLTPDLPQADIIVAMNFSYFLFKSRMMLKQYFMNVYRATKKDGIFMVDLFGGSLCQDSNEENSKYKKYTYYWDQEDFDPVSHRAKFHIHFKLKGQKKTENVFTYDWRMWTIPEIREIMEEVGFKKTHVYWEGTTRNGEGDGVYTRTEKGEACLAWVAYIAAEK